ncbi:hypothetical protein Bca52824_086550 [Brassica carinata]|uniref:Uncharacterized protein n=1 Tax=Brassica carinata TaxID=52824 RepID=A0A8X7P9Q9_BRACI|nr:hypothetical protein Bca52824_086550 [Brassica carinata]
MISSPSALPGHAVDLMAEEYRGMVPCLRRAASVAEEYEVAGGEVLVDDEDDDDKGNEDENLPSMKRLWLVVMESNYPHSNCVCAYC